MKNLLVVLFLIASAKIMAQMPAGRGPGMGQNMNIGHIYGKVVDANNRGIDGATIQLLGGRFDSATKKMIQGTLKAAVTQPNGDFSFSDLNVMGNFTLKISAIGYKPITEKVSFGLKPGAGMSQMMNLVDKDLGNLKMEVDPSDLGNVTVTATRQLFEMGIDRKVFNVDKNIVSTGQTATEVMRTIPTLSVDIDGNVTMRNATPQLFIDGRPTTLTIDQIPADIIDKVELITNPSAKFDASGGNAGILNIVLKKNKKVGYNGGVRAGVDSRGMINTGGDINVRQNKLNFYSSAMFNQRKSISNTTLDRHNIVVPPADIFQAGRGVNSGYFGFLRGGVDYFIDNRNTLGFAANINRGNFKNDEDQRIDSFQSNAFISYSDRFINSDFNFRNLGTQLNFKHNFAKNGHEWTADANYNRSKNDSRQDLSTQTFVTSTNPKNQPVLQLTQNDGKTTNLVMQTDYVNPIAENKKIELGARVSIRNQSNTNDQFFYNYTTQQFEKFANLSSSFEYSEKVYAAYVSHSFKVNKFGFQLGLRGESSTYDGKLLGRDSTFNVDFPLSLFPSAFVTYKLSDKEDLQSNYTRRINRPNFFQLMPFIDYSDPQNLNVGNAGLKPEFTSSFELSYNNNYKKGANFLASSYFKYNTNLISRFQYKDVNPVDPSDSAVFNTFINANNSFTYGLELTNKITVVKWWDMTANFNLFNSRINLNDPVFGTIVNQRTSWFAKLNNSFKLPKNYSVQLSGEYYARTVLPQEGGRGGGRGGFMFGGGPQATAQGHIDPRYSFDIAIKKDWTFKGGRSASLTLSMNDFLRTQLYTTYSESPFFTQTSERRRDPQVARLNFSYRFGKFDASLFKRKNTKADQGAGSEMMGQ